MYTLVYKPQLCHPAHGKNHIRQFGNILTVRGGFPLTVDDEKLAQLRELRSFCRLEKRGAISIQPIENQGVAETLTLHERVRKGERLNVDEMVLYIETIDDIEQLQTLKAADSRKTVKEACQAQIDYLLELAKEDSE